MGIFVPREISYEEKTNYRLGVVQDACQVQFYPMGYKEETHFKLYHLKHRHGHGFHVIYTTKFNRKPIQLGTNQLGKKVVMKYSCAFYSHIRKKDYYFWVKNLDEACEKAMYIEGK